jgi:hypothetical protein
MPFYFPEFASQSVRLLLGAIMPSLIDVAIGVVLIFKAEWIVMRMRVSADKALPISPNEHFQGVAFSILGVSVDGMGAGGHRAVACHFRAKQRVAKCR